MYKKILPLALGGLALGTTEFMMMGLLPQLAANLNVEIPKAGYLISSYAIGVVIGAPLIVALSTKYAPKKILLALMGMVLIFNLLSAFSIDYTLMLVSRFLSGLPHGAFFGIASAVATKVADPGKEARSISILFSGLTLANLVMVPLSTYVSQTLSLEYSFLIVCLISLSAIALIKLLLPPIEITSGNAKPSGLLKSFSMFARLDAWVVLLISIFGFSGLFAWLSYISPLVTTVSGFEAKDVSWIMAVVGAGMFVGNIVGGIVTDKLKPVVASIFLISLSIISLVLIYLFSSQQTTSITLTFLCGLFSMAVGAPFIIMMMKSGGNSPIMGAAFVQAALNLANSIGAYAGGIPLKMGLSYSFPALVGSLLACIGLFLSIFYYFKYEKNSKMVLVPIQEPASPELTGRQH